MTLHANGTCDTSDSPPFCDSADCLDAAAVRIFWPVAPGEAFPVYCPRCAAKARLVAEALGMVLHEERLPVIEDRGRLERGIAPDGLLP